MSSSPWELPRPRLVQLLSDATVQVVVLASPSGYGKTVLLGQFGHSFPDTSAHLRLQPDHTDVHALALALGQAVQRSRHDAAFERLSLALQDGAMAVKLSEAFAADLNALSQPLTLLLDRTEHLGPDAWRWLELLLDDLDLKHRTVLAGYDTGTLPMARLVAAGRARLLTADDLAFTEQEVGTYVQQRQSQVSAQQLHQSLRGWPVGISLATLEGNTSFSPTDLIDETLDRLPPALRDAPPELAPLELWDEAGAARLGCALPAGWLAGVVKAGLPLRRVNSTSHEPHTVLLDALETRLAARPARHAALHAQAAHMALAEGHRLEAFQHLVCIRDWPAAFDLARQLVADFVQRYEFHLSRNVLERLPEAQLPTSLQLELARALHETGDAARALIILHGLVTQGYVNAHVYHQLSLLVHRQGKTDLLIEYAQRGLTYEAPLPLRAALQIMLSSGLEDAGRLDEGFQMAQEALNTAEASGSLYVLCTALTSIATSYARLDQREETIRTFQRANALCERLGQFARLLQNLNNYASSLLSWGQADDALKLTERGVELARAKHADTVWLPLLLGMRGLIRLHLADFGGALQDLPEAAALCPNFGLDAYEANYLMWAAQAASLSEAHVQASRLLETALPLVPDGSPTHADTYALTAGLQAFGTGDYATAQHSLEHLSDAPIPPVQVRRLAYLAELSRRQGKLKKAHVNALLTALDEAQDDSLLSIDRIRLSGLYEECLRRRWGATRFAPFVQRQTGAQHVMLYMTTLGRFGVSVGLDELTVSLKKAQELLVWLALYGATTRQEAIRALWDGSSEDKHAEYFKVALRRLRTALMSHPTIAFDPVVFARGAYQLNERLSVSLDARRFLEPEPSAELFTAYTGDFLPESDAQWIQDLRRNIQDHAAHCAWRLAQTLESRQPDEAHSLFEQAVSLNPLVEVIELERAGKTLQS